MARLRAASIERTKNQQGRIGTVGNSFVSIVAELETRLVNRGGIDNGSFSKLEGVACVLQFHRARAEVEAADACIVNVAMCECISGHQRVLLIDLIIDARIYSEAL